MFGLAAGLLLLSMTSPVLAASTASPALKSQGDFVEGEVLVVPAQTGAVRMASALGYSVMAGGQGKTPFLRLKLKPGDNVTSTIGALSQQSWVGHVQPNYIYHATAVPNDTRFADQWGYNNTGQAVNGSTGTAGADIGAVAAWDEYTNCSAVTVAVIDTGVDYNHLDLYSNIWSNAGEIAGNGIDDDANGFVDDVRGWDFVQGDNDPMDFNEHGTHVSGTIGAIGHNYIGGTGVCWSASIMALRALGSTGSGTTADIASAIYYAVNNGAKVINMSLGGPGGASGDILDTAIGVADTYSVLVVAAAGNDGTNNDTTAQYPASYAQPNILAVAATTQSDGIASFSNFGANSVDIGAPGTNILSSIPPARVPLPGCSWNFDTGTLEGWTVSTWNNSTNTQVTNTVAVTTESSFSPFWSLTDSPKGNYANSRSYRAVSPACSLTGTVGQGVVFDYRLLLDAWNPDAVWIESSPDGVNWTARDGWTGQSGAYLPLSIDMTSLEGSAAVQMRFRLETNASVVRDGMHLDDIAFTVPNTAPGAHSAVTDYAFLNGTSMATPHVAGAAALVWAADPVLTHAQLRSRLMDNGDSLAALAGKTVSGRRLNLRMAMPLHAATGVSANAVTNSRINVSWADNSISEKKYRIQRDTGGGFSTVGKVGADTVAYSDTTAPQGVVPNYRVVTVGVDGRIVLSAQAAATDSVKPVITLIGSNPMYQLKDSAFTDPGSTVSDNFDTGLVATTSGVVDIYTVGSYLINYDAIDSSGNAATTVTRTVKVVTSLPLPPATGGGGGCLIATHQANAYGLMPLMVLLAMVYLWRRRGMKAEV